MAQTASFPHDSGVLPAKETSSETPCVPATCLVEDGSVKYRVAAVHQVVVYRHNHKCRVGNNAPELGGVEGQVVFGVCVQARRERTDCLQGDAA